MAQSRMMFSRIFAVCLDQLCCKPETSDYADSLRTFGTGSLRGSSLAPVSVHFLEQAVKHTSFLFAAGLLVCGHLVCQMSIASFLQ